MTTTDIKTADEYRAEARDWNEKRIESIDRCDTDGFLSQAAYSTLAHRALNNAAIVEAGWMRSEACFDLDGKLIATWDDMRDGDYGRYFIIRDDADVARVGRFISPSNARNEARRIANNAKKGVRVEWVRCYSLRLDQKRGVIEADYDAIRRGEFEVYTPEEEV